MSKKKVTIRCQVCHKHFEVPKDEMPYGDPPEHTDEKTGKPCVGNSMLSEPVSDFWKSREDIIEKTAYAKKVLYTGEYEKAKKVLKDMAKEILEDLNEIDSNE